MGNLKGLENIIYPDLTHTMLHTSMEQHNGLP